MAWKFEKKAEVYPHDGWVVAVDLVSKDATEESKCILQSALFRAESDADFWYRHLDFRGSELNVECSMIHYNKAGEVLDAYIL